MARVAKRWGLAAGLGLRSRFKRRIHWRRQAFVVLSESVLNDIDSFHAEAAQGVSCAKVVWHHPQIDFTIQQIWLPG